MNPERIKEVARLLHRGYNEGCDGESGECAALAAEALFLLGYIPDDQDGLLGDFEKWWEENKAFREKGLKG